MTRQELDYAREAIEETRRTFQIEMRIFTIMDAVLVTLNGSADRRRRGLGHFPVDAGQRLGGCGRGGDGA